MDVNYLAESDESLKVAMDKFTKWIDGQLKSANVDQSVDQNNKSKKSTPAKP